jgi:hypothetical protein
MIAQSRAVVDMGVSKCTRRCVCEIVDCIRWSNSRFASEFKRSVNIMSELLIFYLDMQGR